MEHIFVTASSNGKVCLRDARMAFSDRATDARSAGTRGEDEGKEGGVVLKVGGTKAVSLLLFCV